MPNGPDPMAKGHFVCKQCGHETDTMQALAVHTKQAHGGAPRKKRRASYKLEIIVRAHANPIRETRTLFHCKSENDLKAAYLDALGRVHQ